MANMEGIFGGIALAAVGALGISGLSAYKKAYEITDRINVSGGAIEQMYQLRQFLRQAYQEAMKLEETSEGTDEAVVNAN